MVIVTEMPSFKNPSQLKQFMEEQQVEAEKNGRIVGIFTHQVGGGFEEFITCLVILVDSSSVEKDASF